MCAGFDLIKQQIGSHMSRLSSLTVAIIAAFGSVSAAADSLPPPPVEAYHTVSEPNCEMRTVQIYFPMGEALLTEQAHRSIKALANTLSKCDLYDAHFTAISADGRTADQTATLGQTRIDMVRMNLLQDVAPAHEIFSTVKTELPEPGVTQPMQRRVEIVLDLRQG